MRDVKIYVEGLALELFNDEEIIMESSVQNVYDIDKNFSDYTNSFTVPATPHNNKISEYFYDYDVDGTIDHNLRRSAFIEIDGIPFRSGKIQIEKSNLKDALVESYTYSFYGTITSLKDYFRDDKLNVLDWNTYSHPYNATEIENRIKGTVGDNVKYPLISSSRVWQYDNPSTPSDNIDTSTGAIDYRELFPALSLTAIFQSIQAKYGITFTGNFFSSPQFTCAYLHLKNAEQFDLWTGYQDVDYTSKTGEPNAIDLVNNTAHYEYNQNIGGGVWRFDVQIYDTSNSTPYAVDVYVNGAYRTTVNNSGNTNNVVFLDNNVPGLNNTIALKVKAQGTLSLKVKTGVFFVFPFTNLTSYGNSSTIILSSNINLIQYAPDMKVDDFIRGVMKQFKMVVYGLTPTTFLMEPIDDFYNRGDVFDISKYVTIENIDIERVPVFKNVTFKRQPSESFMNVKYRESFGREYGDLTYTFPYESQDYLIELPFSNLLFNKFTGTLLQVGYCLGTAPEFKPYIPQPTIVSNLQLVPFFSSFYLKKESSTVNLTSYQQFGQEAINGSVYSLNFGADTSTFYETIIPNGAYFAYYNNYLSNAYNRKSRITRLKVILPLTLLTLKLNDRLIIRDHRFIINNMRINMTNGEVDFELLNDFRILSSGGGSIVEGNTRYHIGSAGGDILISIPIKNNVTKFTLIDSGSFGLTFIPDEAFEDKMVTVTVPALSSNIRITEDGDNRITEDSSLRITEDVEGSSIYFDVQDEYNDGRISTDRKYIDYVD